MEHGSISYQDLTNLSRAIELGQSLPLVRLSSNNIFECNKILDAGISGFIIPNIEDEQTITKIIEIASYPPNGKRGIGFSRANSFGRNFNNHLINGKQPLIIPMIESVKGIENLDDILTVKGIDAVFIGPYDLSASLKCIGKFDKKIYQESVNKIKKTCKQHNVPVGIHVVKPDNNELKKYINKGYQFISFGMDSSFLIKNLNCPKI